MERFRLDTNEGKIFIIDDKKKLRINKSFTYDDEEWLNELVDFLNYDELFIQNIIFKYGECIYELNNLKESITKLLGEEIKDCEILYDVDNEDPYTQGRLVEIHNLMKILL